MNISFDRKVFIITGSSGGIGKILALKIGRAGGKVVLNGRDVVKLEKTEKELRQSGCDVIRSNTDITKTEDCEDLIRSTIAHFGKLDVLINNAGVSMRGKAEDLSPDVIHSIFDINAVAPFVLTKIAMPHIRKSKGSVVFISSLAAFKGLPMTSAYSAAKMALTGMAEAMRIELQPEGVHVGIVYVGYTQVDQGKTTIGPNGEMITLGERKGMFTSTIEHVVEKIISNIRNRRKRTTIGMPGKIYLFLVTYFPNLVDWLMARAHKKMKDYYK